MMRFKGYIQTVFSTSLITPIIFLSAYIAILMVLRGSLPPSSEILAHLEGLYSRYGYEIIFLGAFFEGALVIDLFLPGASIVLFGAALSKTGIIEFPLYLITAFLGFSLGFTIDYFLGYFGFSGIFKMVGLGRELEKAKEKVSKFGGKAFLLGYFHPDVATVFVTAAGIIKLPFREFLLYNFLAGFLWLTFWSSIAYLLGDSVIAILRKFFIGGLIVGALIWFIGRVWSERGKHAHS